MTESCDTRFCSLFARSQGEQPIGNAPQTRQFLVVECPTRVMWLRQSTGTFVQFKRRE